jgi:CHAT domain-containing protein
MISFSHPSCTPKRSYCLSMATQQYLCIYLMLSLIVMTSSLRAQSNADRILEEAISLIKKNREDSAASYFQEALSIYQNADSLANWINAHKEYGKAYRKRKLNPEVEKTIQVLSQTTQDKLFRQPVQKEEWDALVWLYVNLAYNYYYKLEDYTKAVAYYEQANELYKNNIGDPDRLIINYLYKPLANLYNRLGDVQAAEVYLQKSVIFFKNNDFMEDAAKAGSDLGMAQLFLGKLKEAENSLLTAMTYKDLSPETRVLLWGNLSRVQYELNKDKEAAAAIEKGIDLLEKLIAEQEFTRRWTWLASLYISKGEYFVKEESYEAAEQALQKARDIFTSKLMDSHNRDLIPLYSLLGEVYHKQKKYALAIKMYHESLRLLLPGYQPDSWRDRPDPNTFTAEYILIDALTGKAITLAEWYEKTNDIEMLKIALQCHEQIIIIEQLQRNAYRYESSKLTNVEDAFKRTEHAIRLALQLFTITGDNSYKETALAFAERSKGTLLLEAFYNSKAVSLAGLPEDVLAEERLIQKQIADLQEEWYLAQSEESADSTVQRLSMELHDLKQKYDWWVEKLEQKYPSYYALKYQSNTSSTTQIQDELLTEEQVFIEYFVGNDIIYVFVVSSSLFEIVEIPKDFPLEEWVITFKESIEQFQYSSSDRSALCRTYSQLAYQLYQKLIDPLEQKMTFSDQLIIVPSGILEFLPFDALLTSDQMDCAFNTYPYLLKRYNICYAYSATLQSGLLERAVSNQKLVGFAPKFDGSAGFGQLNHNIELIEAITHQKDGQFLADEATIEQLKRIAPDYGAFHFATHAQANTQSGNFSFIVFADGLGGYDSLFVKDIYLLPLQAEMVVLSACETSVGKLYQGEGIISLSRSFLYAGANSVITTQWSINDAANRELMEAFYTQLKSGTSKSEALYHAKMQQLETGGRLHAHPVYWAAFSPIGNMRPLQSTGEEVKLYLLGLLLLGVLGSVILYLWRKR